MVDLYKNEEVVGKYRGCFKTNANNVMLIFELNNGEKVHVPNIENTEAFNYNDKISLEKQTKISKNYRIK